MKGVIIVTFLVIFSTILAQQLPPETLAMFFRIVGAFITKCACASGVNMNLLSLFLEQGFTPFNPCVACFIKCLAKEIGLIGGDGITLLEEPVINFALQLPGGTKEIGLTCINQTVGILDPCRKIFEAYMCGVKLLSS
ncbi:hypothetical protein RI129_000515 [Pyrocoelia pectoralis]|uniref:Uncharacterized protein n=1 Tax=Pyrocoelia pectoralis TaxID=417401 RepID=A0AAN7VSG5_9COLE